MVDFYSPLACLYILATTPRLQRICRHFLHSSMLFLSCDMLRINACALFMGLVSRAVILSFYHHNILGLSFQTRRETLALKVQVPKLSLVLALIGSKGAVNHQRYLVHTCASSATWVQKQEFKWHRCHWCQRLVPGFHRCQRCFRCCRCRSWQGDLMTENQ